MLIGLGVSLGMLGIFVIFGICCYTCGKHRRKIAGQHGKDGKSTPYRRSMIYRLPRMIHSRYMRNSSTVGKRKSHNSRVCRKFFSFVNQIYISRKVAHLIRVFIVKVQSSVSRLCVIWKGPNHIQ